ncbi:MAG TPA: glycosyltransferase [Chthoniobacterales bacterium]|jgi:colanic acid/amylovoran biosynthesis glycosyltransferase|nr:glycosyltransferase [Chthoniobacterales bacterium]
MPNLIVASYCTTFLKSEMLHIYRQVKGLGGVQTFVMTKKLQNEDRFPFDDIELIPKPRMNPFRHGWLKFVGGYPPIVYRGEYQALSNLLERRGADLMHIYFGHTGVHLLPFIECWGKPCVVSFHGADVMLKAANPDYAIKLRRLFQAVPLILARSRSLERRLVSLGCPADKIRLNRTGVPLREFPMLRRTAPNDGAWNFLQACRLIPKKGLTTCLRAFALFHAENPKAKLYIAGKGPLQPTLEALAVQLGIRDYVHFTGFLSQPDLLALYHRCHVFIHPSEMPPDENQEGIPNSILEAMATGMPVLATLHGGIPEAVEHGRCGALVEERDHEALAAEMKKITQSGEAFAEMGVLASESVAKDFEQGMQIANLERHYQEAIEIAEEAEAREVAGQPIVAATFPESVAAK